MADVQGFAEQVRDCTSRLMADGVPALSMLFDLTCHRLVRFAAALARHQHDAEDAVQTVLVRLAREPALLARAECPWAYLLRMVRNEVMLIARQKRRCTTGANLGDLTTRCGVDEAERGILPGGVVSFAHAAIGTGRGRGVEDLGGITFAQIGQILEISPNTAASRYQYAMTKLTARLKWRGAGGATWLNCRMLTLR